MDNEKLNKFIRLLKITPIMRQVFDLGLIVKEPESKISSTEILEEIKKIVGIEKITYDKSATDEDVIENFINIFKKNKWAFLEIKKDIGSSLLNQLKHLANRNSFQLIDYQGKDVFEMKMPEKSRLIIFAERDFIENKITYPHFY
ncbi:MAG: hypothetical protein ACPLXL_01540, partial [Minisyncoccia bacterium]